MTNNFTILALLQLILSLIIGVFFMFLTYKVSLALFKKKYQITEINEAVAIILSGILFSTGYILSSVLPPLLNTFRIISRNNHETKSMIIEACRYLSEFLVASFAVAILVNYVSISLFNALTSERDELKEIAENNYQYALILVAIIIVMSIFGKEACSGLLESLVPLPALTKIF